MTGHPKSSMATTNTRAPFAAPEIWLVDLKTALHALEEIEHATPRLSPADEERLTRAPSDAHRRERRGAHIALRLLLERAIGLEARAVPYAIAETGKLSLPLAGAPHFSLAHTGGLALIALSPEHEIGVDIERPRPIRMMSERRAAIERAAIDLAAGEPLPDEPEARFLTAWTRLEAIAKADGLGVGAHLSVVLGRRPKATASPEPRPSYRARNAGPPTARDLALGRGRFGAVALPRSLPTPPVRDLPQTRSGLEGLVE